jgi:sigma-B regulation protein RsbU (phosphoserine phosphatase)
VQRLETEIAEARAFQQSLLPDAEAVVNRLEICCRYAPCSGLGGDLYDYAAASTGQTALLIADVSGHGVSAAMLTGVVKSAFRASQREAYEPLAVVQRVWSGLAAFGPERFVTLFAAVVSPDEHRVRYVNAGHPAIAKWTPFRDPLWLESTGPLVSPALSSSGWRTEGVHIDDGDRLLLYTDGVSDVLQDADATGSAATRLLTMIADCAGGAQLLDAILADVERGLAGRPRPDDLTLLTARVLGRAEYALRRSHGASR